jgi:hypothetical protein
VRIAKVFLDLGLFTLILNLHGCKGFIDKVRKEGRETLYNVIYNDGDEEELSMYEYVLGSQIFETLERQDEDDIEAITKCRNDISDGGDGCEYSDTDDRRAHKLERKALIKKRKLRVNDKTSTPKKSKKTRLKSKTTLDKRDVEIFGRKNTFAAKICNSFTDDQQSP